ncbi:Ptr2p NDAI_0E05020 [Naumovozyma dairenensis CBS 421]|uniref:Peptide transporter PTR2 n=1 Tax=Naumovozyma dairenensis (strain ATCC 10597 / BCRC 20456 / CBS 421 / NBRC 0211 / NRRL Y-12639) TaxID=1071378 RepID=G0WAP6_NAUDC|nr:hypothetical protein NDAI_0E05020 [Naumovozyma dairenensis CBS 421]CCD25319.1 hypothetical protein NDAI_0E05020 [Naumovozyma dairenensis CBS 421]
MTRDVQSINTPEIRDIVLKDEKIEEITTTKKETNATTSSTEEKLHDVETYNLSNSANDSTNDFDDDEMEEGYEEPTDEELNTLKRVGGKIPLRCWLIGVVELAERFSYYGLSAPFQNYMQNGPNDSPKGVLMLNSSGATGLSYFFQFWCYVTPVFGGFVADTYWGKYNSISVGTGFYIVGIFILFITAIPSIASQNASLGGFIVSIILIGIGTGFIKANLSVLIADQLPKRKPRVKILKSGERVIEDPNITLQNVFMVFYLMINIGSMSVMATTELESHKGFWAAYLLPFCFFWIAVVILVFGRKYYVKEKMGDNVVQKSFKVCWIVAKNKLDYNAAKPSYHPERNYPWNDRFVDEMKRTIAACKVFVFYPIYWVQYGSMISTFVTQGSTMELHGIPNDFLQVFDSIALIIFIPIFENFVYPFIRRFTPIRPITKITIGFFVGGCAMTWAAVLQHFIYNTGPCYDHPLSCDTPNKIHVAWQIPAYVLIAFSEIFASITGLEYAYSKAPPSMKSFVMSIFLLTNAFGSILGIALSSVTVDPKFVWLFGGLAVSCGVTGILFWLCFRGLNATEEEMNAMDYDAEIDEQSKRHLSSGADDLEILPGPDNNNWRTSSLSHSDM